LRVRLSALVPYPAGQRRDGGEQLSFPHSAARHDVRLAVAGRASGTRRSRRHRAGGPRHLSRHAARPRRIRRTEMTAPRFTLIGGPTVLIEIAGFRLVTDPTFDEPGDYKLPHVTLTKTGSPALHADDLGAVDAVLLSHDQHADNLDHGGRHFLPKAGRVLTTEAGAKRLGGNALGLAPWQATDLTSADGRRLRVTATPARHGPAGIEPFSGDVVGFVLETAGVRPVYVTGDTVWYDGVAEVA